MIDYTLNNKVVIVLLVTMTIYILWIMYLAHKQFKPLKFLGDSAVILMILPIFIIMGIAQIIRHEIKKDVNEFVTTAIVGNMNHQYEYTGTYDELLSEYSTPKITTGSVMDNIIQAPIVIYDVDKTQWLGDWGEVRTLKTTWADCVIYVRHKAKKE